VTSLPQGSTAHRFSDLAPAARTIWAKSGDGAGHGLIAHLLDVAATVEALLSFEPATTRRWAADAFGLSEGNCIQWLASSAGLHDFGKAIPGFQAKWPEGQRLDETSGLRFTPAASSFDRHDLGTAAHLSQPWGALTSADRRWIRSVVRAISAHHGFHFLSKEINDVPTVSEPTEWALARQVILNTYWQTLRPEGSPTKKELSLPAINWLAGLTSTADWIASNPEWFPLGERLDDLATYHRDAVERGRAALRQIGWSPFKVLHPVNPASTADLLQQILGVAKPPRRLQCEGDQLLRTARGPTLMLVEAPMGEGKTELAFLAHLRLQSAPWALCGAAHASHRQRHVQACPQVS